LHKGVSFPLAIHPLGLLLSYFLQGQPTSEKYKEYSTHSFFLNAKQTKNTPISAWHYFINGAMPPNPLFLIFNPAMLRTCLAIPINITALKIRELFVS
jgi:hypothetical protein